MEPIEIEHTRDRVNNLRARLSDIRILLEGVAMPPPAQDNETRDNMRIALRAIQAVIDDLATVCDEPSEVTTDGAFQQDKAREAKSEVDSDEYDTQA